MLLSLIGLLGHLPILGRAVCLGGEEFLIGQAWVTCSYLELGSEVSPPPPAERTDLFSRDGVRKPGGRTRCVHCLGAAWCLPSHAWPAVSPGSVGHPYCCHSSPGTW